MGVTGTQLVMRRIEMHQSPTAGIFPDLYYSGIAQPLL